MIKRLSLIILTLLISTTALTAQEGVFSPYSFLGIGNNTFRGTAENRSMGGLGILSDSIHVNLKNPAAYADLQLTAFTAGMTRNSVTLKEESRSEDVNFTTFDYLSIGLPFKNFGVGVGMKPVSAVGYQLESSTENQFSEYSGRGGLTNLYFSVGAEPIKNLKLGGTVNYNFGDIENKNLIFQNQVQYASRELNFTDLKGFSYELGALYEYEINDKLKLHGSLRYTTKSSLEVESRRELATVQVTANNDEVVIDEFEVSPNNTEVDLPEMIAFGAGIGQIRKWFVGAEYEKYGAANFSNIAYNFGSEVVQKEANKFRLGGFFIPRYNDPVSYFKRIVFRAGLRYEETGLQYRGEDINEFGISFGLGLPAGRLFTNANLGVEYFERGTTNNNLVQENYISVFLSFSFNDKWFIKSKYN